jgi:hypothetical protein
VPIAYLTIDEVNESLAGPMAAACGLELEPRSPRDWTDPHAFDAVVYDLDFLPPRLRQEVLQPLLAGPVRVPAALHSYHLEEEEAETLRRNGVVVERRLDVWLFEALAAAVSAGTGCQLVHAPGQVANLSAHAAPPSPNAARSEPAGSLPCPS